MVVTPRRAQLVKQCCGKSLRWYAAAAAAPRTGKGGAGGGVGGRMPQFGGKNKNPYGKSTPSPSSGQSIDNWKETVRHWAVGSPGNKMRTKQLGLSGIGEGLPEFDTTRQGLVCRIESAQAKALTAFGTLAGPNQRAEILPGVIATLVRNELLPLAARIVDGSSSTTTDPFYVYGPGGVGKTTLIAQAQALAHKHGYLILPISRALEIVKGDVDYSYDGELGLYHQPMYYARWLKKVAQGNRAVLESIPLSSEYTHPNTPTLSGIYGGGGRRQQQQQQQQQGDQKPRNLFELIDQGRRYRPNVVPTFQRFVYEIFNNPKLPPVLLTLDSISAWTYKNPSTAYFDQDMKPINVEKLFLGDLFFKLFSGLAKFSNGGLVITTTSSKLPECCELKVATDRLMVSPYSRDINHNLIEMVGNAKQIQVDCFTLQETGQMIEFYRSCQIIQNTPSQQQQKDDDDESFIGAKYLASGNGNPRDLLRSCAIYYK